MVEFAEQAQVENTCAISGSAVECNKGFFNPKALSAVCNST